MPRRSAAGDALTDLVLPAFELNGEFLAAAEEMTRPVGLTPAWWQVLGATLDEPLTVAEIARRVGLGLARAGVLDERAHTSNAPDFLAASGYAGAARYVDAPVVEDRDVITAPATKPVDFTAAVFRRLEVFPPAVVDAWYGLYTTGERRYFDAMAGAGAA